MHLLNATVCSSVNVNHCTILLPPKAVQNHQKSRRHTQHTKKMPREKEPTDDEVSSENESDKQDDDDDEEEEEDHLEDVDEDTLRIMLSTDNHLGYMERDPVRGLDSFAAFEEMLYLAKKHNCDKVLLGGDLFHENKPSRHTLYRTMEILRRYTMGSRPVSFHIMSDQKVNFRSVNGTVNYEDPFYSVDLPIFSIHGNHDDPCRDGGTEMLAALDLLSASNLVNYFGSVDEVNNINVSPILINKGTTNVALYGLGNLRDERLNRSWQSKKVKFLKPKSAPNNNEDDEDQDQGRRRAKANKDNNRMDSDDSDDSDDEEDDNGWFNIFCLHQNRDAGRGTKNCVHESMIPEWIDVVVWGHEHECRINVQESLVGTFRITQPGSSVATSLVYGESVPKCVGILDIRGQNFRLTPKKLRQVRPFYIQDISLNDHTHGVKLDPDDPNLETKISKFLTKTVREMLEEVKEEYNQQEQGEESLLSSTDIPTQQYKLEHPEQALIRLRVENSNFTAINKERFGQQFVGEIANPSDVLLFHRKRQTGVNKSTSRKSSKSSNTLENLDDPIPPQPLNEHNVEKFLESHLNANRLELLDQEKLGLGLEYFVEKEQTKAFNEIVEENLIGQQRKLVKRGADGVGGGGATSQAAIQEILKAEAEVAYKKKEVSAARTKAAIEEEEEEEIVAARKRRQQQEDEEESDVESMTEKTKRKRTTTTTSTKKRRKANLSDEDDSDAFDDDDDMEPVSSKSRKTTSSSTNTATRRGRPTRGAAAASKRTQSKYNFDGSSDDDGDGDNDNDDTFNEKDVVSIPDDSDDSMVVEETPPPTTKTTARRRRGTGTTTRTTSTASTKKTGTSARGRGRTAAATTTTKKAKANKTAVHNSSDDDDEIEFMGTSSAWGSLKVAPTTTAKNRTNTSRRRR